MGESGVAGREGTRREGNGASGRDCGRGGGETRRTVGTGRDTGATKGDLNTGDGGYVSSGLGERGLDWIDVRGDAEKGSVRQANWGIKGDGGADAAACAWGLATCSTT